MTRDSHPGAARPAWPPASCCRAAALACPACRGFTALNAAGCDRRLADRDPAPEPARARLPGRSCGPAGGPARLAALRAAGRRGQVSTGPAAGAFLTGYRCGGGGRPGEPDWLRRAAGPGLPSVLARGQRNEDQTIRRGRGRATMPVRR